MSNKLKKIIGGIATIIIFVIGAFFYLTAPDDSADDSTEAFVQAESDSSDNLDSSDSSDNSDSSEAVEAEHYEFRKQQYLDEHFAKHGEEFDYADAQEYLEGANRVINDPNSLYKTEAEDGDHIYYLESSNEFVVVATDGYIRTYFRPSAGIDYFNRQ